MKLWMRKAVVVLVAIMTLGLYVPPTPTDVNAEDSNKEAFSPGSDVDGASTPTIVAEAVHEVQERIDDEEQTSDNVIHALTEKAKQQTMNKLGPKIRNQVEDEFASDILPGIENVLTNLFMEAGEDEIPYYGITEDPSDGYGERIFNVYDVRTHRDIARFHVRRDNRPLEGYWFNFHYHLSKDNFEKHHVIGEIYWDKNMPPKWMA